MDSRNSRMMGIMSLTLAVVVYALHALQNIPQ